MKIDTTSLSKALQSLREVLALEEDDIIRDSAIKRFEFTYSLCIKFMQRQLEDMMLERDEIDKMTFPDMIRTAAEKGLIDDPVIWFEYRKKRNITAHAYDEEKAEEVYAVLKDFASSAEYLLNQINKINS